MPGASDVVTDAYAAGYGKSPRKLLDFSGLTAGQTAGLANSGWNHRHDESGCGCQRIIKWNRLVRGGNCRGERGHRCIPLSGQGIFEPFLSIKVTWVRAEQVLMCSNLVFKWFLSERKVLGAQHASAGKVGFFVDDLINQPSGGVKFAMP